MSYAIDRPEILLMENQLVIEKVERAKSYQNENINNLTQSIYCHAVFEEYSRKYETVLIAPNTPPMLEICDYHNMNSSLLRFPDVDESHTLEEELVPPLSPEHTRVMQNYHPIGIPLPSVFRKTAIGNKYLVDNYSLGYTKLLVSIGPKEKISFRNKISEPIFGTVSLYCMSKRGDGDLVKIAETFNFDATPTDIRHAFQHVYRANTLNDISLNNSNIPLHFNPLGIVSKCLFSFPSELLVTQDIFLVIELSKVLTGDPDRSLLPYISPDKKNLFGGSSDTPSLQDTCTRLRKFRQPLGISVMKVFNDGQVFQNQNSPGGCVLSVYALKHCISDAGLKQHIQDMFPPEGASPQVRLEATEVDVCLSIHNLGSDYLEKVKPPVGLYSKTDEVVGDDDYLYFFPSHFHTEAEAEDISWCQQIRPRFAVRSMLFHPPLNIPLSDDALRSARASLDHTLFLFPVSFENFHRRNERNLCMEIQLIEFTDDNDDTSSIINREYTILNHIYNPLPGYMFSLSQCTLVSYHKTNPDLNDEVKIRLPMNITKNHYLLFHIYHVHVKARKAETRGSIGGFFSSKKGEDTGEVFSMIGQAYLPLLNPTLICDGEYVIPVIENASNTDDGIDSPASSTPGVVSHQSGVFRTPSLNISDPTLYTPTFIPYSQVYAPNVPTTSRSSSARRSNSNIKSILPTITIRTKVFSSFVSTNKDLQHYFNNCPVPLSRSIFVPNDQEDQDSNPILKASSTLSSNSQSRPESLDSDLRSATMFFLQPTNNRRYSVKDVEPLTPTSSSTESSTDDNLKMEICRHFPSLMKQIIRILCGGVSVYQLKYMNPYSHSDLRCATFLALLRIFDTIAPNIIGNIEDEAVDSEFLRSYVEYAFDEEIYSPVDDKINVTTGSSTLPDNSSPSNSNKLLKKKAKSMDLVRRQLTSIVSEEELFENTVDHVLEQVIKISFQGVLLSSINKIVTEINHGKLSPSSASKISPNSPSSNSSNSPPPPPNNNTRWWKGHISSHSILDSLTKENSLDYFDTLLTNHIPQMHPLKDPLILDPILPPFRTLDGYLVRKLRLNELMLETDMKSPPYQWWPWMYEIITYQWRSLLDIFDNSTISSSSSSANTSSSMNTTTVNTSTISTKPDRIDEVEEEEEEEDTDLPPQDDASTTTSQTNLGGGSGSGVGDESNSSRSGWYGKEPYPFLINDPILKDSRNSETIRSLLIKYGPILLNIIFKSLALRISREKKLTPVILDEEYIHEAELLFSLLGKELHLRGKSMLPSRRLNISIAIFFRNLFSLIVPLQVSRLIYSFLISSRKIQKENQKDTQKIQVDQIKIRINFLYELSKIDHFFALNFSLHFGENPLKYHYIPIYTIQDILNNTSGTNIRGIKSPPNHWLIHLIINEIMSDYPYLSETLKENTLKILRELIIRFNYDKRYQTIEYQNRIASMFLPLLSYFLELSNHLYELTPDSIERRDSLAIVIYLLQEIPEYIIREEIRNMTTHHPQYYHHHYTHRHTSTLFQNKNNTSSGSGGGGGGTSSTNKSLITQSYKLPIMNMITLLHLIIDTFELSLSDGGEKGDVSVALSPGIIVDSIESQDIGNNKTNTTSLVYNKSQIKSTEDKLTKLEALNNKRRVTQPSSNSTTSQSATATATAATSSSSSTPTTSSRPTGIRGSSGDKRITEERNWKKSLNAKASSTMTRNLNPSAISVLRSLTAAKYLNYETSLCVLNILHIMIIDCPKLLQSDGLLSSSIYSHDIHYYNENFKEFLINITSVLLHFLHSTQSEICLIKAYGLMSKIILLYGFPIISSLIGDTLQYWIRKILTSFGSCYANVRQSSIELYEICLQSCYQYQGTLFPIILPTYGVINDILLLLKNKYRHIDTSSSSTSSKNSNNTSSTSSYTHYTAILRSIAILRDADHDIYLENFNDSLYQNYQSSKINFLNNFLTIINVLLFINNRLGVVIPYDWNGGLGYNNLYESFKNSTANVATGSTSSSNPVLKFKIISDEIKLKLINDLKNLDLETIFEQFVKASDAFGTYNLPRFKIYILENLCILHEIYNQVAEMGMIRWKIYEICEEMMKLGIELWSPKPPLKIIRRGSDSIIDDRQPHFMALLISSLNQPIAHPWISLESLRKHAILSLQISIDLFRETHLIYLAERSLNALLGIYRSDHGDNLKDLNLCYDKLSKLFDDASKGKGNMNFAMGTFFRVLFIGQGVPSELRGKEYIVRNGSYLHVSEFQSLIKQQLQLLVGSDIPVYVLPDTSPMPSNDAQEAYAYMTSLNPVIINPSEQSNDIISPTHTCWKKRLDNISYRNEYNCFQFSVPYTKEGKAHAKTMDLQWKRTTILTVKHPFPYILTRQMVIKREVRDLSPIEVALDDIQERVISMIDELRKPPSKLQSDINNLMRLVQGTVVPQVNAGAAEVAKVFLPKIKIPTTSSSSSSTVLPSTSILLTSDLSDGDPSQIKYIAILKEALVQFLDKSRSLLEKYRSITGVSMSDLPIDTRSRSAGSTASIPHSIHFNQSVGYTSSLPSSSTSQSLMNFSNLCANKHYQKNFIIRKYYTRETEAMIQQQMNQDSSSTSSSSLSTTIPSSSISNSDINKSSISSNSTIVINPSGLSSSSSLVTGGGTTAALAASGATGSSSSELVWLTEMEKGYDILVDAIYPYICDIATLAERN